MARSESVQWRQRLSALALSGRSIVRAWKSFLAADGSSASGPLALEDQGLPRLRQRIEDCLQAKGGAVSARARAAELGQSYLALDDKGRQRFLSLLAQDYGPDRAALARAAEAVAQADAQSFPAARQLLVKALVSPRLALLRQFNGLDQGVKFLVDLRADLLRLRHGHLEFAALEGELHDLLASWFDVGFLTLARITWNAPAALLEKLVAYEAVHEIRSWGDLKNRLDSDRRCYAFFHPAMPDEPLIFVEVALVKGLAANVQDLLDENAPAIDAERADTAIFYSISNAQAGLQGVAFGDFLIKRVVDEVGRDLPNIKTFATLSPIPGFRAWLMRGLGEGVVELSADESQALRRLAGEGDGAAALSALLERPGWSENATIAAALAPILTRQCARFLLKERRRDDPRRALDAVAHFHLTNGARVERINWLADRSKKGLVQSAGLMVNYLYRLADIEANHERYRAEGRVAAASAVRALAE